MITQSDNEQRNGASQCNGSYYRSAGDHVKITRLRPIERASNFDEFADYVHKHIWKLGSTRLQFAEADTETQKKMKADCPYFVPGVPKGQPVRNNGSNVDRCNLLFLDIDAGSEALEVVARLLVYGSLDLPWPYLVHHTVRSTEKEPRLRVIVAADGLPPSDYDRAISTIARKLGQTVVTRESYEWWRAMFFPVVFNDEDTVAQSPVIADSREGAPITLAELDTERLPIPGEKRNGVETNGVADFDALLQNTAPVEGWELEDAREVVELFSSDAYDDWLKMGMALKNQFGAAGFEVWNEWSARSTKHPGESEARRKWDNDFAERSQTGVSRTWRTYIFLAKRNGWKPTGLATRQAERLRLWITDRARTETELRDGALVRIASYGALSTAQREDLLGTLAEAGKHFRIKRSVGTLRGLLRDLLKERHSNDVPEPLPSWAGRFCYVGGQVNVFYNVDNGSHCLVESFNNQYARALLELGAEGTPKDYVLKTCKMETVDGLGYDPREGQHYDQDGQRYVNTYRPTFSEPDYENAPEAERLLSAHLENLIAEPENRRSIMDWMAYQVQHPGEKVLWAPLIQGAQGCGKSTLFYVLGDALGRTNVYSVEGGQVLSSSFNAFAFGHQLVAFAEVHNTGENRSAIGDRLKDMITEPYVEVNLKNVRQFMAVNVTNYMLFTNHRDALSIEDTDRRYFVVMSPLQTQEDLANRGVREHCRKLHEFRQQHPGAFRAAFLSWEISKEFEAKGHAPITEYKQQMLRESESPLRSAIRVAIEESESPAVQSDLLSFTYLMRMVRSDEAECRARTKHVESVLGSFGWMRLSVGSDGRAKVSGERHSLWGKRNSPFAADPVLALETFRERMSSAEAQPVDVIPETVGPCGP